MMAAWARVDMAAYPERSMSAQANLALALAEAGNFEAAVEAWKRVRWTDRAGIGEGTRAYYLGVVLDRLGREGEAVRAFRRAASSRATIFTDDGPGVAPAAVDHLVDLGVSPTDLKE
jgi:Flp pilus assembly protein TadD